MLDVSHIAAEITRTGLEQAQSCEAVFVSAMVPRTAAIGVAAIGCRERPFVATAAPITASAAVSHSVETFVPSAIDHTVAAEASRFNEQM